MLVRAEMQERIDGQFVPHFRLPREQFANLHAGHVGRDRAEFAAEFLGCVRLEVVHVDVRRAAGQVNQDGGLVGSPLRRGRVGAEPQQVGQGQAGAEGTDLEKVAAVDAVAVTLLGAENREHGNNPPSLRKIDGPRG